MVVTVAKKRPLQGVAITEEHSATGGKKGGVTYCFKGWGAERPSKGNALANLRGVSQADASGVGW